MGKGPDGARRPLLMVPWWASAVFGVFLLTIGAWRAIRNLRGDGYELMVGLSNVVLATAALIAAARGFRERRRAS